MACLLCGFLWCCDWACIDTDMRGAGFIIAFDDGLRLSATKKYRPTVNAGCLGDVFEPESA
ncbi:hypothetical protein A1OK_14375 [Enterovibrio norvegicus FF-454]|uniref:Uncharacterized protein n=1 Tax=Enterovibrio norvegicus FF-454 TaxID=1185651 RepID=A0A1E5C144_9GAMM|nr:hypothetical protein A1OK_14375 [Enterovibrio norvegicus FF-454]